MPDLPAASEVPLKRAWTRSLRFQLTLWYTGVLAVLLLLASGLFYGGTQQALRTAADGFLASEAQRLVQSASDSTETPPDADDPAPSSAPRRLGRPPETAPAVRRRQPGESLLLFDIVYSRLMRRSGTPLFQSADLAAQPAMAASLDRLLHEPLPAEGRFAFAGPDEERMMRVLTLPVRVGPEARILQVAVPWDHNADVLEHLARTLTLGLLIVLACAAVGGWALIGRTLQPIGRIVAEAERLDAEALPEVFLPRAVESDSEIGLLVATLNRMTRRLRRAFETQHRFAEAQQRFAADASHELRTPLTILRGEMDLALTRPREAAAYRATLASAVEEVARMSRIVEGLSFLARQDAGQMGLQRSEPVDLARLCRGAAGEMQTAALAGGVAVSVESDAPLAVTGDADQFHQLLRNLLDNALKHTPPGGRVGVEARRAADGAAVVTVTDTGRGIAAADLPHVFERFWRADRSRTGEGSGLGLAICRRIAETHGGTLTAQSGLGTGSMFSLRLPPADPAARGRTGEDTSEI